MAVDFCLNTTSTFDDLSLSAEVLRYVLGYYSMNNRRGAKVMAIGGIGKYDLCTGSYDYQRI